jgi:hypothetical protein
MITISGHKGNANQNHTKNLPHSCNYYHQEHQQQQMLAIIGKKGTLTH